MLPRGGPALSPGRRLKEVPLCGRKFLLCCLLLSSVLAWAQEATTSPAEAPIPEAIAQPSAPTSTPTGVQEPSTPAQPQTMREALLLLRSKLVELKTLSREQPPALRTISGALSGAISLNESDSSDLSAQSTSVSSALSEATTSSTSASASLTAASSSQTEMAQAHEAEAAAAATVQADLESELRTQKNEKAAWRTGALAAAGGLAGAAFGPTWAALGAVVGAAAGGAWWVFGK